MNTSLSCKTFKANKMWFSLSASARRLPHQKFPLTNEQLSEFGGKRSIKARLTELGLSPIGFRAVLRERLREFNEGMIL
jgi:hypothetical protein